MKEKIISEIIREMLSSLNNEQLSKLKTTLEIYLYNVSIEAKQEADKEKEEVDYLEIFLSAKRIEGCSEKTLIYYKNTIQQMIDSIGKSVCTIVTEDLRTYLAEYQKEKQSSKQLIILEGYFQVFLLGWRMKIILLKVQSAEYIELRLLVL